MKRPITIATCCILIATATAAQPISVPVEAQGAEQRLTKCFADMLAVIKRHKLRSRLWYFLEAGCTAESATYEAALRPYLQREWQRETGKDLDNATASTLALPFLAAMERRAGELYRKEAVIFCSGDACALDDYRKCLVRQILEATVKRAHPRVFEESARHSCQREESNARAIVYNDFVNAQRLQWSVELSARTEELIDLSINELRHEVVVTYAEALTKVQPGRKSCRTQMCGDIRCISLVDESEYKCAIGEIEPD
jgi:hypothetical protein